MIWIDYLMLAVMLALGGIAAVSDIKYGRVSNKLIAVGLAVSIALSVVAHGFFRPQNLPSYLCNIGIFALLLLCLYAARCFAGGDLKLGLVLAILYPSACYLVYGSSLITLFFALGLSIFLGYLYLLARAVYQLAAGKMILSRDYAKRYVLGFARAYATAILYVAAVNLAIAVLLQNGLHISPWISLVLCFLAAWFSRRLKWMRSPAALAAVIALDAAASIYLRVLPVSLQPGTYLFAAVIILCQMMITASLYQRIATSQVEKGMILSVASSVSMQTSRVRGLPNVSHEDLRDRLTEEQAASVRRWGATAKGSETVVIMKKIPFAIFLVLGFLAYFMIWRFL